MVIEGGGPIPPKAHHLFFEMARWRVGMARKWIAISLMTGCVLFTAFTITMALSYQINERCTDQMAQNGNC
jgi:hypothetical protein